MARGCGGAMASSRGARPATCCVRPGFSYAASSRAIVSWFRWDVGKSKDCCREYLPGCATPVWAGVQLDLNRSTLMGSPADIEEWREAGGYPSQVRLSLQSALRAMDEHTA